MRYAIAIEGETGSYSAYVPDLPGCVAAAETLEELVLDMQAGDSNPYRRAARRWFTCA